MNRSVATLRRGVATILVLFGGITSCWASSGISRLPPNLPPPPPPGAPVTVPGPFQTDEYTPVTIQLDATNSIGDSVSYRAYAGAGTVQVDGTVMTYTPFTNHFFMGDTITFYALDFSTSPYFSVFSAGISISGTPVAGPPVISFNISEFGSFPGTTNPVVFPTNGPALISFDCVGTYSTELLPVIDSWYEGTNCVYHNEQYGGLWEYPGTHTITLSATDGISTNSESATFEVLAPGAASAYLENFVNQSALTPKTTRRLGSMLFKASNWFNKGRVRRGYVELSDFQKRIQSGKDALDPALATELENAAQEIINALPPY
jgi:hypothetical protein